MACHVCAHLRWSALKACRQKTARILKLRANCVEVVFQDAQCVFIYFQYWLAFTFRCMVQLHPGECMASTDALMLAPESPLRM